MLFWPGDLVEIEEAYAGRKKLVRVVYQPLQYNPVTRELRHYRQIPSELSFGPEQRVEVAAPFKVASSAFDEGSVGGAIAGDCDCSEPFVFPSDLILPTAGQASDFARRQAGADFQACFKVRVTQAGIHRLTYANLLSAGVPDAELVGNNIRMFYKDREIAIDTSTDGKFSSAAEHYISFYGEPFQSNYSNDNFYWIGFGAGGLRWASRPVDDVPSLGTPITEACRRVSINQGTLWFDTLIDILKRNFVDVDDGVYDGWFAATITEHPANGFPNAGIASLYFPGANHAGSGNVTFSGTAYGITPPGGRHEINATNQDGVPVFNYGYFGVIRDDVNVTFPSSALSATGTTRLDLLGVTSGLDRHNLRDARLEFNRLLIVEGNRLNFGGTSGAHRYEVDGLSSTSVAETWLMDVSDGFEPVRLTGFSFAATGNGNAVRFADNQPNHPCYFIGGSVGTILVTAADILPGGIAALSDTGRQHDYIAIVPAIYESEARRLLEHRDQLGVDVLVATDEEIYNEFGYGIHHPMAIHQFLGFAFHHWVREPKYVMLVGDGHFDPLNRIGQNLNEVIPAQMKVVSFAHAPVDALYAQVNGADKLADMAVGRMPVNNLAEFRNVVDKILVHDVNLDAGPVSGTWRGSLQMVADNQEAQDPNFAGDVQSDLVDALVSFPYVAGRTYLPNNASAGQENASRTAIINAFNSGKLLVNYVGHGSTVQWTSENIFDSGNASALNNSGVFPVVTVFTCQNGIYHLPHTTPSCMAETLLRSANRGAVAVIAPGAPADHISSLNLSKGFYNAALNGQVVSGFSSGDLVYTPGTVRTVGDAYLSGLAGVFLGTGSGAFELEFYTLFGDPATLIRQ